MSASINVEVLNALLRGELAAVEAYHHVIARLADDGPHELCACLDSHRSRVDLIDQRIAQLGGIAAHGPRWWGGFAVVVEGIATLLGQRAAIAALEQCEQQADDDYRDDCATLDAEVRHFVETHLVPEQARTLAIVRSLLRSFS